MSKNKKAKHNASDLGTLARQAVENAKARRLRVLEEGDLTEAVGGLMTTLNTPYGIPTQVAGYFPNPFEIPYEPFATTTKKD